jgi:hypothetical protein
MKVTTTLLFIFLAIAAIAQKTGQKNQKTDITIPIKAESWDLKGGKAKFVDHKGLPSIELAGDLAIAKNLDFTSGTIEFDIDAPEGFVGIYFRRQSEDESEFFYLREVDDPLTSPAAIQYTPIIKKINMWDMYPDYQTAANFSKDNWIHIKLVISGLQMLAYVNDKTRPAMQVFRLEGNTKNGAIAFAGTCFVANVVVRPNEVEGLNPAEGFDPTYNDIRYIKNWQISNPAKLPVGQELNNSSMPDIETKWQPIVAERRGLVNITRLHGTSDSRQYVWVRSKIISKTSRKMKIELGFSDEVWVFLNDRTVFVDKNLYGQGMRKNPDGRISPLNANFEVQLNEGENDLVVGIANDFYGWGIIARLNDLEGISLNSDYKPEVVNKDFEKYFGLYSAKDFQVKLKISQKNGKLSALPTAQSPILFEKTGENTFYSEKTKLTLEFNVAESKMTLKNGSQTFVLTRE